MCERTAGRCTGLGRDCWAAGQKDPNGTQGAQGSLPGDFIQPQTSSSSQGIWKTQSSPLVLIKALSPVGCCWSCRGIAWHGDGSPNGPIPPDPEHHQLPGD